MLSLLKNSEDTLQEIKRQVTELEEYEAKINFQLKTIEKEPKSIKCIGGIVKKIFMILVPMWIIATITICSRVPMKNMLNFKEFNKNLTNREIPEIWHPYAVPKGEKKQISFYEQLLNTGKITTEKPKTI